MENQSSYFKRINITPKKKLLRSMATDLDFRMALFEIIDNSIDAWKKNRTNTKLMIHIYADREHGTLTYQDNAGGVEENNIAELFTLGDNGKKNSQETIGEFGVGLKRALFFMAKRFVLESKALGEDGFRINLDVDRYFDDENWEMAYSLKTDLDEGSTRITFSAINFNMSEKVERDLRKSIAETYAYTLTNSGEIFINNTPVTFYKFEAWAKFEDPYNMYSPKNLRFKIDSGGMSANVSVKVGLMETSAQTGDYGFYIYCNDRLAIRAGKTPELGFNDNEFHYPHARLARFRCEIFINGPGNLMPWNSTKSGLNFDNPLLKEILPAIKKLSYPYLRFSSKIASPKHLIDQPIIKIFKNDEQILIDDINKYVESYPEFGSRARLQKGNKRTNRNLSPWKQALLDAIKIAEGIIMKDKPEHKNRVAVLILDSTIEISLRDYLIYVVADKDSKVQGKEPHFDNLMKDVRGRSKNQGINKDSWEKISNLHRIRDDLYHNAADITVEDKSVLTFKEAVLEIISKLFNITF